MDFDLTIDRNNIQTSMVDFAHVLSKSQKEKIKYDRLINRQALHLKLTFFLCVCFINRINYEFFFPFD